MKLYPNILNLWFIMITKSIIKINKLLSKTQNYKINKLKKYAQMKKEVNL